MTQLNGYGNTLRKQSIEENHNRMKHLVISLAIMSEMP